jgi:hypothetical protein
MSDNGSKIIQPNKIQKNSICPYIPFLLVPVQDSMGKVVATEPRPVGCLMEGCVFYDNEKEKCKKLIALDLLIKNTIVKE